MPPLRTAEIKSRPSRKRFIFVRCLFLESFQGDRSDIQKKKRQNKKKKQETSRILLLDFEKFRSILFSTFRYFNAASIVFRIDLTRC